jgi:hypothetical protein
MVIVLSFHGALSHRWDYGVEFKPAVQKIGIIPNKAMIVLPFAGRII